LAGPIVRISPRELHIADSEFFDMIYTSTQGFDKSSHVQDRFGAPEAAFSTPDHDVHKRRRAALSPFFAKRRIHEQAPMIQGHVNKITKRLHQEYAGNEKILNLNDLYSSYVSDVILSYGFNRCYGFLDQPDFISSFTTSIQGLKDFVHYAQQFPWLPKMIEPLPDWVVSYIQPSMKAILHFQNEMRGQVKEVRANQAAEKSEAQEGTIFFSLIRSDLLPEDLTIPRLKDEAMSIVGAGIETTKMASVVTSFHIINTPRVLSRLQAELQEAIPDPSNPPPLSVLEKLPYLYACLQEGIRLSYGAIARSQRISKHNPIKYNDWVIPPGVMVSLDTYHMHHDENVFPESFEFKPERWLGNPRGPNGEKALTKYLTAFGRGTRMCVGFNLAYAEMTLVLAALFRVFDFALYETDRGDVDCYRDMVGLEVKPGSKGVRVKVNQKAEA
jgi:cytochrome P450